MDDLRTQETLDALADLFLTNVGTPRKAAAGQVGPPPARVPPGRREIDWKREPAPDAQVPVPASASVPALASTSASERASATERAPASPSSRFHSNETEQTGDPVDELTGPASIRLHADHGQDDDHTHQPAQPGPRGQRDFLDQPGGAAAEHDSVSPVYRYPRAEAQPTRRALAQPKPAFIEAVFLGNLPGFGGPWLTQYAFHLAQRRGPTAIVHVTGDRAELELVTAGRQTVRGGEAEITGYDADALVAHLSRLSHDADHAVVNWLIHLPSPVDPEQLGRVAGISRWTFLCGADDAAVASAARMLRELSHGTGPANQPELVSLMVMGCDETKAREAIDKFNATAADALSAPAELIGSRRQMTPVHMRALGAFEAVDVWPQLRGFLDSLPAVYREPSGQAAAVGDPRAAISDQSSAISQPSFAGVQQSSPASVSPAAGRPQTPGAMLNAARQNRPALAEPIAATAAPVAPYSSPAPAIAPRSPGSPTSNQGSSSPRVPHAAAPATINPSDTSNRPQHAEPSTPNAELRTQNSGPRTQDSGLRTQDSGPRTQDSGPRTQDSGPRTQDSGLRTQDSPCLAALVDASLGGVIALQARHPRQREVEIVLDQSGRLHLLARQVGSDLRAALVDLMEVRDWAREHFELISLTQRQCRFDAALDPVLHLFTSDARTAVSLASRLGAGVKLHLLQEVRVGAAATWVCTDLN